MVNERLQQDDQQSEVLQGDSHATDQVERLRIITPWTNDNYLLFSNGQLPRKPIRFRMLRRWLKKIKEMTRRPGEMKMWITKSRYVNIKRIYSQYLNMCNPQTPILLINAYSDATLLLMKQSMKTSRKETNGWPTMRKTLTIGSKKRSRRAMKKMRMRCQTLFCDSSQI